MSRAWVVFFVEDKELFRYTLYGEAEDERDQTIKLLAYENGIEEKNINCVVVK